MQDTTRGAARAQRGAADRRLQLGGDAGRRRLVALQDPGDYRTPTSSRRHMVRIDRVTGETISIRRSRSGRAVAALELTRRW
jgi:hypothetical protein